MRSASPSRFVTRAASVSGSVIGPSHSSEFGARTGSVEPADGFYTARVLKVYPSRPPKSEMRNCVLKRYMCASEMSGALSSRSMLIKERTGTGKGWQAVCRTLIGETHRCTFSLHAQASLKCQSSDSSRRPSVRRTGKLSPPSPRRCPSCGGHEGAIGNRSHPHRGSTQRHRAGRDVGT